MSGKCYQNKKIKLILAIDIIIFIMYNIIRVFCEKNDLKEKVFRRYLCRFLLINMFFLS